MRIRAHGLADLNSPTIAGSLGSERRSVFMPIVNRPGERSD